MVKRILLLAPFVVGASACNNNQAELASLRAQAKLAQDQNAALVHQVKEFEQRITRLETQRGATDEQAKQPPAPPPPDTAAAIPRAIADCVRKVCGMETSAKGFGQPYAEFDAFYNQGSGRVENNNRYVDQGPNYAFNKCNASKGVPLT